MYQKDWLSSFRFKECSPSIPQLVFSQLGVLEATHLNTPCAGANLKVISEMLREVPVLHFQVLHIAMQSPSKYSVKGGSVMEDKQASLPQDI